MNPLSWVQTSDSYGYQGKLIVKFQTQGTFAAFPRYHTQDVSQFHKIGKYIKIQMILTEHKRDILKSDFFCITNDFPKFQFANTQFYRRQEVTKVQSAVWLLSFGFWLST